MVIVELPVLALDETLIVIVDVVEPVIEVGLKLTVTPDGAPDDDSVIAELNPPDTVALTVAVPLDPREIVVEVGETVMANAGTGAVTVSVTVVVLVSPRPSL